MGKAKILQLIVSMVFRVFTLYTYPHFVLFDTIGGEMTPPIRLIAMATLGLTMSVFTGHAQTVQNELIPSVLGKPRIPITSLPLTITSPGYYYLLSDTYYNPTSLTNRIAITVISPGVMIDLRGHTLTGPFQAEITVPEFLNLNPVAISIQSSNVTVKNGTISGFFFQIGVASLNTEVPTYLSNITITAVKFTEGGEQSLNLGNVNNSIVSNCSFGHVPEPAIIDDGSQTGNRYLNDTVSASSGDSPISIIGEVSIVLNIQPRASATRN